MPPNNDPETTVKTFDIAPTDELAKDRFIRGFTKKVLDESSRTVSGTASSISVDRDGEVILPTAFKKDLKRFLASSAPYLAAHLHRGTDAKPTQIGWVMTAKVTPTSLECEFRYAKHEAAEEWWLLASDPDGKGHAFSVGFLPKKALRGSVSDAIRAYAELADVFREAGFKNDQMVTVYTELELLEISGCPVSSNRLTLQHLSAKLFNMDGADGAKAVEELEKLVAAAVESAIRNPQSAIRNLLQAAIDNIASDLAVELDRQFSEIKSLLPDIVNPQPEPSAREDLGEADDAAAGKSRALEMRRAADALRGKTT